MWYRIPVLSMQVDEINSCSSDFLSGSFTPGQIFAYYKDMDFLLEGEL